MGLTGDFGRLSGTIAALSRLSAVPSRVATIAAPKLEKQAVSDTESERDPYARAYAPHAPATVKRWGKHSILDLTGQGIGSISVRPSGGAGIQFTADEHMRFAQGGTVNEPVRAIFPNSPSLPKSWRKILDEATAQAFKEGLRRV